MIRRALRRLAEFAIGVVLLIVAIRWVGKVPSRWRWW